MLSRIRGNEAFKDSVQAALQAGRLSNSVLLCAEEGCGAGFAARCLAADFLFPEGGDAAEAVLAGRSSECIEVRGQGQRGEILVGQARQVRSLVYETALSAAGLAPRVSVAPREGSGPPHPVQRRRLCRK